MGPKFFYVKKKNIIILEYSCKQVQCIIYSGKKKKRKPLKNAGMRPNLFDSHIKVPVLTCHSTRHVATSSKKHDMI